MGEGLTLPPLEKEDLSKLLKCLNNELKCKSKSKLRNAVMTDFLINGEATYMYSDQTERPKQYRIQGEYGEKKFIKP